MPHMRKCFYDYDRLLNGRTHRVALANVNVFGFKTTMNRLAKERGLRLFLKQDGPEFVIHASKKDSVSSDRKKRPKR